MVPTVPLKGWDRVAAGARRNSRSGPRFPVALVGDDAGGLFVLGSRLGGDKWGGLWGRGGDARLGGAPVGWCPGVPRVSEWPGKGGHPQRGPPVTAGSD